MKKVLSPLIIMTLILLSLTNQLKAQAPDLVNYQAVVRNSLGLPLNTQAVTVRFTIHQGSPTGASVFQEVQATTTNQFGLINLQLGSVNTASFSSINWGTGGAYYLQIEVDAGSGFEDLGASQLLSVPYALFARSAATGQQGFNSLIDTVSAPLASCPTGGYQVLIGLDTNANTVLDATEIRSSFYVCNGSVAGGDNWGTDTVNISGSNISGSGTVGNPLTVTEVDGSITNEIQTLSLNVAQDTLFLSNGGSVQLPSLGADNDWLVNGNNMVSIPSGNVGIGNPTPLFKLDVFSSDTIMASFRGNNPDFSAIAISNSNPTSNVGFILLTGPDTAIFGLNPVQKMLVLDNTTPGGHIVLSADSSIAFYGNVIGNFGDMIVNQADTIISIPNTASAITHINQGTFITDSLYKLGNNAGNFNWVLADNGFGQAVWTDPTTITGGGGAWTSNGTETFLNSINDNVGIGTIAPTTALHIMDPIGLTPLLLLETTAGNFDIGYAYKTALSEWFIGQETASQQFRIADRFSGTIPFVIDQSGNVGIGTALPASDLEVIGETKTDSLIITGGAGTGLVLTSDAVGNARWQAPSVTTPWTSAGTDIYPTMLTDNVSIGVVSATNTKFQIDNSFETSTAVFNTFNSGPASIFGINSTVNSTSLTQYGVYSFINSISPTSFKYGYYTAVANAGNTNYGIYSEVSGATTNWSAFFADGNVYVADTIVIPTNAGVGKILISDATGNATWQVPPPTTPAWNLLGNIGTVPTTNFIGTTDAQNLEFRTNNIVRTRITQKGQIEILNTGNSVFLGEGAGANDDLSNRLSTFVGYQAGNSNVSGTSNTSVGYQALQSNATGGNNVAIGAQALNTNTTGSSNVVIGFNAYRDNNGGNTNVVIGREAGLLNAGGSGNIFIGYQAGRTEAGSNTLYIDNSSTTLPLISGNFASNVLQFNGSVNINGAYTLPTIDGTINQVLATDGLGNVTWQTPVTGGAWNLLGNAGTVPGNDFIGTTDAQSLEFRTNNVGRMLIDNTGLVGIGTSTPGAPLHIANGPFGTSALIALMSNNANATNPSGLTFFKSRGTEAAPLPILGNDEIGAIQFNAHNSVSYSTGALIRVIADENYGSTTTGTHMEFHTTTIGTSGPNEAMRIADNGFIGIGTISPNALLDVTGVTETDNLRVLAGAGIAGDVLVSDAAGNASWQTPPAGGSPWTIVGADIFQQNLTDFVGIGTNAPTEMLAIGSLGTATGTATQQSSNRLALTGSYWNGGGVVARDFTFHNEASTTVNEEGRLAIGWSGTGTELMSIESTGNVGIGTTTPGGLLHLYDNNTNANASQLTIEAFQAGSSTYAALEFRSKFSSSGVSDVSGRIKSYYTAPGYATATTTFQTIGVGASFVDAMSLMDGKVGIGTTTPSQPLDVIGKVKITDGTEGLGNILTSDAAGIASWKPRQIAYEVFPTNSQPVALGALGSPVNLVNFDGVIFNDGGTYNPAAGTNEFVAPVAGVYQIEISVLYNHLGGAPSDQVQLGLMKNGSPVPIKITQAFTSLGAQSNASISATIQLNVGDYLQVETVVVGGSTINIVPSESSWFSGHLVYAY